MTSALFEKQLFPFVHFLKLDDSEYGNLFTTIIMTINQKQ